MTPLPKGLVQKHKDRHFRFVLRDPRHHMREMLEFHYEVANTSAFPELKGDPRTQADGTFVYGDLLLVHCDAKMYEERMRAHNEATAKRLRRIKQGFHGESQREGVPTFEHDKPGSPE